MLLVDFITFQKTKRKVQKVYNTFKFLIMASQNSNYFILNKYTQRNSPLAARGKSFWENPLNAKRLSFGIKYVPLEAKN